MAVDQIRISVVQINAATRDQSYKTVTFRGGDTTATLTFRTDVKRDSLQQVRSF